MVISNEHQVIREFGYSRPCHAARHPFPYYGVQPEHKQKPNLQTGGLSRIQIN